MSKLDENKIKKLREAVAGIGKSSTGKKSLPLSSYTIATPETPKLDALEARVHALETEEETEVEPEIDAEKVIAAIKGKFDISHLKNGENLAIVASKAANKGFDMNDQRWHGGSSDTVQDFHVLGKLTVDGPIDPTYIEFVDIPTPSNPPVGSNRLYFKSDDFLYMKNSAGVEQILDAGGVAVWGSITGLITNQTDLITYLSTNYVPYTGANANLILGANSFDIGTGKFTVDTTGNITKLNNVIYSFPASQGGANTVLKNNGAGILTWSGTTAGIDSLNTDTTSAQTLTTGTAGTDFAIVDNLTGNHAFNLPIASAVNTGKLSNTDWSTFNGKLSTAITSINGQTGAAQILSTGSAGTDFNIGSVADVTTFNIPSASTLNRGLVTTGAQTLGGVKTLTSAILVTPDIGTPSAGTLTNTTGLPIVAGTTGTLTETRGGTNQTAYATGDVLYASAANTLSRLPAGANGDQLTLVAGIPAWAAASAGGTVTSVAASVPAFLSVAGSPITTSGTLAITLSGTALPVANGGTGQTASLTSGGIIYGASTTAQGTSAAGTSGQVLISGGAGAPTWFASSGKSLFAASGAIGTVNSSSGNMILGVDSGNLNPEYKTFSGSGNISYTNGVGTATIGMTGGTTNNLAFWSSATTLGVIAPGTAGNQLRSDGTNVISIAPATAQSTPANPTGTTNTTGLMMGLAGSITPATSGKVLFIISGSLSNNTNTNGASVQIRQGTGTAPTNGAALTGTAIGGKVQFLRSNGANAGAPFSCQAIVSGLTVGVAVWIDIGLAAIAGGTAAATDISISAIEI